MRPPISTLKGCQLPKDANQQQLKARGNPRQWGIHHCKQRRAHPSWPNQYRTDSACHGAKTRNQRHEWRLNFFFIAMKKHENTITIILMYICHEPQPCKWKIYIYIYIYKVAYIAVAAFPFVYFLLETNEEKNLQLCVVLRPPVAALDTKDPDRPPHHCQ